jgi:hypothetical protein
MTVPARLGMCGRPDRRRPPPVLTRTDLPAKSLVCLLLPVGWTLTPAGEAELDRLVRGAVSPDSAGRSLGRRGCNVWLVVLTADVELVMAALRDLALEYMVRISERYCPPSVNG